MKSRVMMLGAMAVILVAGSAFACGPFFDDAYLVRGSEQEFLSMPEGDFKYELEVIAGNKMVPQAKEEPDYHAMRANTASADIEDLKEAMKLSTAPDWQKAKAIQVYGERRAKISEYLKGYVPINPWKWYGDQFRSEEKRVGGLKIAIGSESPFMRLVPKEFILYSEGAVAYHNNDFDVAIKKWKELLGLPEDQRKYRSVWSAFMIGKVYLSLEKDKEAIPYFEMARKLASEGYKDSLNLAQESYGWQALAEYETKKYAVAISHYLKNIDVVSMYRVCRTIADLGESDFENVVKDETVLRVLVGWVVSHSSYYFYSNDENEDYIRIATRLTTIIEKNSLKISSNNADRVAWMFYNLGKFDKADSWLKISKEQSALSQWIRAKLLIREGKVDKAIEIMRNLKHSFAKDKEFNRFYGKISADVERKINTEHSILLLSRKEYMMAFGILLQGAYWEDIAYIAEKVLTKEELENYLNNTADVNFGKAQTWEDVESRYDDSKPKDENPGIWLYYSTNLEKPTVKSALYYLLARRYARDRQWDKALQYMPIAFKIEWEVSKPNAQGYTEYEQKNKIINLKDLLSQLKTSIVTAENASLPAQQRANGYFKAALITRQYGMELIGTELDPDGFVFRGGFAYDDSLITRFAIMDKEVESDYGDWYKEYVTKTKARREEMKKGRKFIDGSQAEEDRVLESLPAPFKRFHYRYKAADLMWKCAELLPNNDELKAKALCLGGTYLKYRDKVEANKFYKALVKTCGKTKLGIEANKLHWFPKIPEVM